MPATNQPALNRRLFMHLAGGAAVAAAGSAIALGADRADLLQLTPVAQNLPQSPLPPLPDQLDGGRVEPPSQAVPEPLGEPEIESFGALEEGAPTSLPFTFNQNGHPAVMDLPETMKPWRDRPTKWENITPNTQHTYLDADGVIQYRPDWDVPGYDQPVTQIQFALGCITSYRNETDPTRKALFLKRAKAQAGRLLETRVETRGAWYFPYPFDFTHTTHSGVEYQAPWYSGMAQGEAISLFIQLSDLEGVTEEERTLYRAAADGAFASLLLADDGTPWVVNRNSAGYLWIQEYPGNTPGTGDYTYNGMIFAMFGLWDYIDATGSELAMALWDGACTTIERYFPLLRNLRWISFYCQTHRIPAQTYHQHHINLLRQLHWQTGSPRFARMTDQLTDDYPWVSLATGSNIAFAAGTHTLYKFDTDSDGDYVASKNDKELARKTVTFGRATQAPANRRRRIKGRGVYYRINAGGYAGWWIGESFPKSYLVGEYVPTVCHPARTLTFPANTEVTCYKVGTDGRFSSSRVVKFANRSNAPFDRRSVVNGRPMYRISAGSLTGYWVWTGSVTADGN
ncbi:D-glucuronyl C5-epimerase family protein [Glycomyces luteolus]|uniref:D-glucuronyl C5-epimerase family protein n=1 Tax=Glycomyces luteolus TaxID=2670330 RepID=A0A9X3SPE3_9ACTN|nr:D-glucuronyl C5-epimerase family protein [Glycomyces luteolus]MDA1359262.1 D-glucuronyl C5-epimerase family protein [Glycomyces luteolus]